MSDVLAKLVLAMISQGTQRHRKLKDQADGLLNFLEETNDAPTPQALLKKAAELGIIEAPKEAPKEAPVKKGKSASNKKDKDEKKIGGGE